MSRGLTSSESRPELGPNAALRSRTRFSNALSGYLLCEGGNDVVESRYGIVVRILYNMDGKT